MTGPDSLNVDAVREDPDWLNHLPEENNLNTIQYLKANSVKKNKEKFVSSFENAKESVGLHDQFPSQWHH